MPECAAPWRPPQGFSVELVPAGRFWDAVRVPLGIGAPVIAQLGDKCGGVIRDRSSDALYWLIAPGAADEWPPHPGSGVTVLGITSYVAVPPVARTEKSFRLWWEVPLEPVHYLTDADLLRAALDDELSFALGPRALLACEPCIAARIFNTSHDACTGVSGMEMQGKRMRPCPPQSCPCDHQPVPGDDA